MNFCLVRHSLSYNEHWHGSIDNEMMKLLKFCCFYISQRWLFTMLSSIGLCIQNAFSVIISITIIEMVQAENIREQDSNRSYQSIDNFTFISQKSFEYHIEKSQPIKSYSWDEYTQGIILSSFSWSNTIVQFFYGSAAERFGGKHLLGFGILVQAVLTFTTPFAVSWGGSTALIITRVLIGLGSDGMYPVVSTMISRWTTPEERTLIGNTIYSGPALGLFFGNILPVLIIKYSGMGWPAVFYIFGIFGVVWFPFWLLFVYEDPEKHPFISQKELDHLKNTSDVVKSDKQLPMAPWKDIMLCKAFWAFTIGYTANNFAYYLMLSDLPKYMGDVVKFSLESNGYFTAIPYLLMWLNTIFSAWISDKIFKKNWMSLTNIRKLLLTVSSMGPGIFLLLASYAECDKTMVVIMFMIGITSIGSFYSSALMNPLDLSPNYAGSIMSVGSGIASLSSMLAPYLVGVLAPNSTIGEWRIVFWIVFISAVISNGVYLVWFKAEVQPWNDPIFDRSAIKSYKNKEEIDSKV